MTEATHIVAIRTTGNVFSYDAIEMLNIKRKHWKDLLTDEPFAKADIITIQVGLTVVLGCYWDGGGGGG